MNEALRTCGKPHHVRDFAERLDLEPGVGRHDDDALDQAAQLVERLGTHVRLGQRLLQRLDVAAVGLGDIRVKTRQGTRRGGDVGFERVLALLEIVEFGLQAGRAEAVVDGLDQAASLRDVATSSLRLAPSPGSEAARCRFIPAWKARMNAATAAGSIRSCFNELAGELSIVSQTDLDPTGHHGDATALLGSITPKQAAAADPPGQTRPARPARPDPTG
jgi:hypothetical protein